MVQNCCIWSGETLTKFTEYKILQAFSTAWWGEGVVGRATLLPLSLGGLGAFCLLAWKCAGRVAGWLCFPSDITGCLSSVWFSCLSKEEHLSFLCCCSSTSSAFSSPRLPLTQTSAAKANCEA